jgi:hypothetical protein
MGVAAFRSSAKVNVNRYSRSRLLKPSALHSSLPTPWCTKNRPLGSTFSLMARSRA